MLNLYLAAVSPRADHLFETVWFTNSTLYAIVVVVAIVAFVQIALRRMSLVPNKVQNFCEWVVESLYVMLESIVGKHMIGRTFSLLASLFLFILAANISGLLPGVGTIGWGEGDGFFSTHVHQPLIRPANADVNMTFSLALLFMGYWLYWTFSEVGFVGFFRHTFGPKGLMPFKDKSPVIKVLTIALNIFLILIFLLVGGIEIVSIASRVLSLPLRLFGNVFAGENLLHAMGSMGGFFVSILVSMPFYILEILVSVLQALVFMLLCAVYIQLSTAQEEHH